MPIKTSGQLSLRYDILAEIGGASYVNLSLRNMSSRAGFTTPDAMSEFYGYGTVRVFPLAEIGFDASSFDRACVNAITGRYVRITGDGPALQDCSRIYSDAAGTTFAARGYYAEGFTQYYRYWSGSGFTAEGFCRV